MLRALTIALLTFSLSPALRAEDAPKAKSPTEPLQGTWLFDEATLQKRSQLGRVNESVITVSGDSFTLTKMMGAKADLKGTLVFDPKDPSAVDLKVAELDLSELLEGYKVPAGTLAGRYKLDGDQLTLCFPAKYTEKRPEALEGGGDRYLAHRLSREWAEAYSREPLAPGSLGARIEVTSHDVDELRIDRALDRDVDVCRVRRWLPAHDLARGDGPERPAPLGVPRNGQVRCRRNGRDSA